jgi:hypothetical protein
MLEITMRKDLAEDGLAVPAFDDIDDNGDYVGKHYITEEELLGAELEGNTEDDKHPRYDYTRLRLRDGRLLYFIGVDLDFYNEGVEA